MAIFKVKYDTVHQGDEIRQWNSGVIYVVKGFCHQKHKIEIARKVKVDDCSSIYFTPQQFNDASFLPGDAVIIE